MANPSLQRTASPPAELTRYASRPMRSQNKLFLSIGITGSLVGCLGAMDGSEEISKGYEITFTSPDGVFITYAGSERPKTIVVDARVDGVKVVGDQILVARRPMETYFKETSGGGALSYRMLSTCEHWSINTSTHEVKQTAVSSSKRNTVCLSEKPHDQNLRTTERRGARHDHGDESGQAQCALDCHVAESAE